MATNLRLSHEAAAVLRQVAAASGRSQQDLLREAVDRYLGLGASARSRDEAIEAGIVKPPTRLRDDDPPLTLRRGGSSLALLDRDDR
jgi:hypothetical protein